MYLDDARHGAIALLLAARALRVDRRVFRVLLRRTLGVSRLLVRI
jgi:hypothetical protein